MGVRAKVVCSKRTSQSVYCGHAGHTVAVTQDGKCNREFEFAGVYSQDPNHENKVFSDHTPSISVKMQVMNADVDFQEGREYYLDFRLAQPTLPYEKPEVKTAQVG